MSLLWLRAAVVLYGAAALAVLPASLYSRPAWRKVAIPAAVAGVFFHFVSLIEMLVSAHRALPVDTHESLSLLALLLAGSFLLVAARYGTVSFGVFVLPVAVLLMLVPAFRPGHETLAYPRVHPALLFLHVFLLLAAYAALFLSLLASLLYLVQERRLKQKRPGQHRAASAHSLAWLPPLETIDQIALRTLLVGLPCMTIGLLVGSMIALQTSSPAFFADPKVLLSLALWVAYILMIFIRRHSGLRGSRAVYLSSAAFLLVLAVWAANQLSVVHRFRAP